MLGNLQRTSQEVSGTTFRLHLSGSWKNSPGISADCASSFRGVPLFFTRIIYLQLLVQRPMDTHRPHVELGVDNLASQLPR